MAAGAPIRAAWFDGRVGRGREVLVVLEQGPKGPTLLVHTLEGGAAAPQRFPYAEVEWPARWSTRRAPARLTVGLGLHGSIEVSDPDAWQRALAEAGARDGLAQRMQTRWPVLVAVLVAVALGLFLVIRHGAPWAGEHFTRHVPLEWELALSREALAQLDGRLPQPSRVPAEVQAALRVGFDALLASIDPGSRRYAGYAPRYSLQFRRGIGANAFALPGGTVVLTDELLELAERRGLPLDAVLGVLAHEIGHVEHRHGTRLLIEQGVMNVGMGLALGDVSSLVSLGGTLLTGLAYQRAHESEADCFALALMARAGVPSAPMGELLQALSAKAGGDAGGLPSWLGSHPPTPERVRRLAAGVSGTCDP
jgi:predicted Zn-dependent protease